MKNLLFVLLMFTTCGFASAQTKTETVVIKTTIHCSHCLQCGSCGPNIENAVKENKGVSSVAIDPKIHTVTVVFDPEQTSADKIRKSISKIGYDADDVKASAAGYDKLDGCCKKH